MARTSTHLDTPIHLSSAQPEQITVTDPTHPLYGRNFPVVSMTSGRHGTAYAYVDDRNGTVLRVSIMATNLHPAPLDLPTSKLTLDAIRDLVRLASQTEPAGWSGPPTDAGPAPTVAPPSSGR